MRILIVEDDKKIGQYIQQGLTESGFVVDWFMDGEEGLISITSSSYHLAILDLMLPKLDGLSLLAEARKKGVKIPILILSARQSVDDRVLGLQKGGDDYLTKPFSFSELLARVQALLRRSQPQLESTETTKLTLGGISLDLLSRMVTRDGKTIEIQTKEFALLEFLMRNPGRVLTKTQLLERVWSYQFDPQTNVVDVLVFRLRAKIDKDFDKKLIQTIRGVGYVFQPD